MMTWGASELIDNTVIILAEGLLPLERGSIRSMWPTFEFDTLSS